MPSVRSLASAAQFKEIALAPVAAVVLKDGAHATDRELREFLAASFAKWQLPDAFVFVEAIPRTSVGKFKKMALREQFADWKWES